MLVNFALDADERLAHPTADNWSTATLWRRQGEYGGGFSLINTGGWVELGNGGKPKKQEIAIADYDKFMQVLLHQKSG